MTCRLLPSFQPHRPPDCASSVGLPTEAVPVGSTVGCGGERWSGRSMAAEAKDPFAIAVNPDPPVEFGAPGIDLDVAWSGGASITATGNSFAAPHVAGSVALILAKHPGLTPFQVKAVLQAAATNARG